jgi:hypothetical protein
MIKLKITEEQYWLKVLGWLKNRLKLLMKKPEPSWWPND